jgi:peptide/nickel transport system permease protein
MAEATRDAAPLSLQINPARSAGSRLWRVARRKPLGAISAVMLLIIVIVGVGAPVIATHNPARLDYANVLVPPLTGGHLLGTDEIGRDVFSRVVWGARFSLHVSITATLIGVSVGILIGTTSGWFGGLYDLLLQRVVDTMQAFPGILLALALVSVLAPHRNNIIFAIAIGMIPASSRVVRGVTMSIRREAYIEAATVIGAGTVRSIVRHVLPNIMAPIIVILALNMGVAILIEAALTFLGVAPLDAPSWGAMLSGSGRAYLTEAPHLALIPGIAITITVLSLNLLGDSLRDVLDPRMRGS